MISNKSKEFHTHCRVFVFVYREHDYIPNHAKNILPQVESFLFHFSTENQINFSTRCAIVAVAIAELFTVKFNMFSTVGNFFSVFLYDSLNRQTLERFHSLSLSLYPFCCLFLSISSSYSLPLFLWFQTVSCLANCFGITTIRKFWLIPNIKLTYFLFSSKSNRMNMDDHFKCIIATNVIDFVWGG